MKSYTNVIQKFLNKLDSESVNTNRVNYAQKTYKITVCLPESIYNKPIVFVANNVESCAVAVMDMYSNFCDAINNRERDIMKTFSTPLTESDKVILKAASKESLQARDAFESGYFTIEGDPRKYSTNQTPFHYYFAKGRMSFEEMLDYAAVIYTPAKKIA